LGPEGLTNSSLEMTKAHFTLQVKAKVERKLNIPMDAIIEINPKGFTLEIEVDFFNLSLYGLDLAQRQKIIVINLEGQLQPLRPMLL
jgi:hypothetical protein